mmetsp:Transcript_14170/g.36614  ORF Transcript_14170/g.36614 Transcript_14170/m.36614 type:complete len:203 (+) Transcript_14170:1194-1802(+)
MDKWQQREEEHRNGRVAALDRRRPNGPALPRRNDLKRLLLLCCAVERLLPFTAQVQCGADREAQRREKGAAIEEGMDLAGSGEGAEAGDPLGNDASEPCASHADPRQHQAVAALVPQRADDDGARDHEDAAEEAHTRHAEAEEQDHLHRRLLRKPRRQAAGERQQHNEHGNGHIDPEAVGLAGRKLGIEPSILRISKPDRET